MSLQKILNNLVGIIVEYCTSQLKISKAPDYSKEELKKLIEDLNKVNPLRVPLLNYLLNTVNTVQALMGTNNQESSDDYGKVSSLLIDLLCNCQRLIKIPTNALAELTIKETMYGLQTWSPYSGYVPCHSGSLIVDKLFTPLKLTPNSDIEAVSTAINKQMQKLKRAHRIHILEAENARLQQEYLAAKIKIEQLSKENQTLIEKVSQISTNLVTVPLSPASKEPLLTDRVFNLNISDKTEAKAESFPEEKRTTLEPIEESSEEEEEPAYNLVSSQCPNSMTNSTLRNRKSNHVQKSLFASKDVPMSFAGMLLQFGKSSTTN